MQRILNFHGIGEPDRSLDPGEDAVWIGRERFGQILDLAQAASEPAYLTFDDGNQSDYISAVPALRERSLRATFFVVVGRIDQLGFLTSAQIREIDADPLFTIGSHGMHHRPWPELGDSELLEEIVQSRAILSQICGRSINEVALPFGRYDRRTLRMLESSGYSEIFSSDGAPRLRDRNPRARLSVRRDMSLEHIKGFVDGPMTLGRIASELRAVVKGDI